ncbi:MAG TPA: DUF3488 and transglutaminase-like domain-containing protein [Thiobacillaceae bacterium]|nr:DUF3488 and transglutaminase-like domain-containing protein [Thiobacillaceae bacterium]HNU64149.1 DUF3488 and transglutaminase-like domain-containing protein [Thiobacillaceae bacterium]
MTRSILPWFAAPPSWSGLLLALALAGHAPALPTWALAGLILACMSRILPPAWPALAVAGARLVLLVILTGAAWFHGGVGLAIRVGLLAVLSLKWAESRVDGEHRLVVAASLLALALGILAWQDLLGFIWVTVGLVLALAAFHARVGGAGARLGNALKRLALAAPLAVVLFIFFPRIPGPLWDVGYTLGLPLTVFAEKGQTGLGMSTTLKPGGSSLHGPGSERPVLVAEFKNYVPATALLYWRGPVFYDYDGQAWHLDADFPNRARMLKEGWRRSTSFKDSLAEARQLTDYSVRLSPHGGLWLFGLDVPAGLTTESYISRDWQVMSITPMREESTYRLKSWLRYRDAQPLDADLRRRALALPAGNPRLKALGAELSHAYEEPRTTFATALALLNRGGYRYAEDAPFPGGPEGYDRLWFEHKTGNAEQYAGALTVLLRAAGIPARLVTGFRGGKLMALTDFVVVKRQHAHAWVEAWLPGQGWSRADPSDLVAPERFAGEAGKAVQPKAAPRPSQAPAAAAPSEQIARPAATAPAGGGLKLPDLEDWLGQWVIHLDGGRQARWISGAGLKGPGWLWLLAALALAVAGVSGAGWAWSRWQERRAVPADERAWRGFARRLREAGVVLDPAECPSRLAARLEADRPDLAPLAVPVIHLWTRLRYAPAGADTAAFRAAARRFKPNPF